MLGAGGTLGEAWLRGVLNGLEAGAGLDFRECEYLLGTSAGSIVAATLAAGRRPDAGERAAREWARAVPDEIEEEPETARFAVVGKAARAAATPFANVALSVTAPAGRRRPGGRAAPGAAARPHARRPGRAHRRPRRALRRAAADLRRGSLATASGSCSARRTRRAATVAEAVLASCSVPWLFAPVQIGEREYVDGGVWSPTNLDAVPSGQRLAGARAGPDGGRGADAAADRDVAGHEPGDVRPARPRGDGDDDRPRRRVA